MPCNMCNLFHYIIKETPIIHIRGKVITLSFCQLCLYLVTLLLLHEWCKNYNKIRTENSAFNLD
jgi:hypothetical protein